MKDTRPHINDILGGFDYEVPPGLIAQKPASPRDSSKLLVYERGSGAIFFDKFLNLPKYLPKNAVIVFNETKVIPARLVLKKETGGKAVVIFIEKAGNLLKVMSDRKLKVGSKLALADEVFFEVISQRENFYLLHPSFPISALGAILDKYGVTPIPPYIKNSPLSEAELRQKYQAIFARTAGSIAAPTASLHFTKRLIEKIKRAGIDVKFVTLHINLGTFAPLRRENLEKRRLHEEFYEIDGKTARFLNAAKSKGRPIVAVGTTVIRTLESAAAASPGKLAKLTGATDLFIRSGYEFKFADQLITNFHVPRSSLMMLVSALTGREKLLELYRRAITAKFRLFSFGDGMYIKGDHTLFP